MTSPLRQHVIFAPPDDKSMGGTLRRLPEAQAFARFNHLLVRRRYERFVEIIGKIVSHIRRIKPHVVVSFGPDGTYGHPDHIALSQFTNAALVCAADRNFVDASVQSPHRVLKFYYMVDSLDIVGIANKAFGGFSMDINGVTRHHIGWEDWQITTHLDNNKYLDKVQKAIRCHKSQLPGYGPIAEWSLAELEPIFGTGSFYRAFSLVNGGRKIETDLFEGLR